MDRRIKRIFLAAAGTVLALLLVLAGCEMDLLGIVKQEVEGV